jgi:hypothetical protein
VVKAGTRELVAPRLKVTLGQTTTLKIAFRNNQLVDGEMVSVWVVHREAPDAPGRILRLLGQSAARSFDLRSCARAARHLRGAPAVSDGGRSVNLATPDRANPA